MEFFLLLLQAASDASQQQPILPDFSWTADISDILTLLTLIVTFTLAWWSLKRSRESQQASLTLSMLETYNSELMSASRSKAWYALYDGEDKTDVKFIGLRDSKSKKFEEDVYESISRIEHFWGDINKLWDKDKLDKELAVALFTGPFCDVWGPLISRLDYRENKDDTRDLALRYNKWNQENVLPLDSKLCSDR